jgi:hypothetical protein
MEHTIWRVEYVPYAGGYPFRAVCSCGWRSKTYAAIHAAQTVGEDHVQSPDRNRTVLLPS